MQFKKSLIAAAALAAGSAFAATPVAQIAISSGASASKNNLKIALANRCSGQLAEYTDGTANVSTYVCAAAGSFANPNAPTIAEYNAATAVNFTGTAFAELRLNVNNGSFTAICLINNWPGGTQCPAPDQYWSPSAGAMAAPPAGSAVIGGLMDVEPTAFTDDVRAGISVASNVVNISSASFGQAFGVAVSPALYNAMFAQQQAAGLIPASPTCDVTLTNVPACVPSIGKAQVATIMAANTSNAFYTKGANFLASSLPNPTAITYARRVDTSGTQASAQQYFLGNVCNPSGQISVIGGNQTIGPVTVTALPTTGGVRTLLNSTSAYVIGIISGENNQTGQSWRWLRVGGMPIAENAAPGTAGQTNTFTTLNGLYDYWFLSRVARPAGSTGTPAAAGAFWSSVITGLGAVPAGNTPGLFRTSETAFTKGTGTSCKVVGSN